MFVLYRVVTPNTNVLGKSLKEYNMNWTTPKIIDTAVGMEINCYACAVL